MRIHLPCPVSPFPLHRARSTSAPAGFTLFELVLVLVLMTVAASLIMPNALSLTEKRLDVTVRNAYAMARHARDLAVTGGAKTRIHFDPVEQRFWLETENDPFQNPGVFSAPSDEWGEGFAPGAKVRMSHVDDTEVVFQPDGTAEDALIAFASESGEEKALEIRGMTGLSRVLEGEELDYVQNRNQERP